MHIIDRDSNGGLCDEFVPSMVEYICTNSPFESVIKERASLDDLDAQCSIATSDTITMVRAHHNVELHEYE